MDIIAEAAAPTRGAEWRPDIKDDPDTVQITSTTSNPLCAPSRIKQEPQYVKIDLTALPEGEEDDMFEDVDADGDEYVDLTYEGIAHVNGVRHFVCEG
jgi:hypothetical protein